MIFAWFGMRLLSAQISYPADSLLIDKEVSWPRKLTLLPIAGWQRISYNTEFLNCQFYPSCSNYGALAIRDFGLLPGIFVASDRIVRCNPGAYHYHRLAGGVINEAGFLIDPVRPSAGKSSQRPLKAALLSAILPGVGRIYAGRWYEGLLSGCLTIGTGRAAYLMYKYNHHVRAAVYSLLFLAYYGGEIYGAWRTAKYYVPDGNDRRKGG